MRTRFLAVLLAALVLSVAACTAAASRLEFGSPEGGFSSALSEFRIAFVFNNTLYTVTCPVTLAGSFHSRTVVKTSGTLIGFVTRASVNEGGCGGTIGEEAPYPLEMSVLAETLPWHVTYSAYLGTLPSISGALVRIAGPAFQVRGLIFEQTCLYAATAAEPLELQLNRAARGAGTITSVTVLESEIPRSGGSLLCSREPGLIRESSGTATQLSGADLVLTLI